MPIARPVGATTNCCLVSEDVDSVRNKVSLGSISKGETLDEDAVEYSVRRHYLRQVGYYGMIPFTEQSNEMYTISRLNSLPIKYI